MDVTILNHGREGDANPDINPPEQIRTAKVPVGSTIELLMGRPRVMLFGVGHPPVDCVNQIDLRGSINAARSDQF